MSAVAAVNTGLSRDPPQAGPVGSRINGMPLLIPAPEDDSDDNDDVNFDDAKITGVTVRAERPTQSTHLSNTHRVSRIPASAPVPNHIYTEVTGKHIPIVELKMPTRMKRMR